MTSKSSLIFILTLLFSTPILQGTPKPVVLSTIPDLAWMIQEIGGNTIDSQALLKGTEDPHYVDALPDFVRRAADARIVCVIGLDLEVGYMPSVLGRSGNARIQGSGPGVCNVGRAITVIQKPSGPIDRSMGDVHPSGNPHYYLSPLKMLEGSKEVLRVLSQNFPEHRALYERQQQNFELKMKALHQAVFDKLSPIRAAQGELGIVVEYHKEFAYFLDGYGLKSFGSIEEKPGVPPSAGRLVSLAKQSKDAGVKLILSANYNPQKTLKRFAELSGLPLLVVPTMIQAQGIASSYERLQHAIADKILEALPLQPTKK